MSSERVFLSPPDVGPLEEERLLAAFRSGWVAPAGPELSAFERDMAERVGTAHAVALSSGTAALHLALLGVGVRPGDAVVTSTLTFAATANAVVYAGAEPVFVDVDAESGNMAPELAEEAIEDLRARGTRVGALMPVDLLGRVADYAALQRVADRHGIPLVADAAEAVGSARNGRPAGSFGAVSGLSFNGNKIMTTSGGGMLTTDDAELADRARYLATQARLPVRHYEHVDVGYNYRLSNLLAAMGRAQLQRLDGMIARRRAIRDRYRELFADVPGVQLFQGDGDREDNHWLSAILVDDAVAGWTPDDLVDRLERRDIESRPLWRPMHLQPVFAGATAVTTGVAERLFRTGVTLPSGSALSDETIDRVVEEISAFVAEPVR